MRNENENINAPLKEKRNLSKIVLKEGKDFLKYLITIGVMSIAFLAGLSLFPATESIPLGVKAPVAVLTSALLYVANEMRRIRSQ